MMRMKGKLPEERKQGGNMEKFVAETFTIEAEDGREVFSFEFVMN